MNEGLVSGMLQMTYDQFQQALKEFKQTHLEILQKEYELKSGLQAMNLAQQKEIELIHRSNEISIAKVQWRR